MISAIEGLGRRINASRRLGISVTAQLRSALRCRRIRSSRCAGLYAKLTGGLRISWELTGLPEGRHLGKARLQRSQRTSAGLSRRKSFIFRILGLDGHGPRIGAPKSAWFVFICVQFSLGGVGVDRRGEWDEG